MGLSSKQVCSSGLDWNQTLLEAQDLELPKPKQQQQQQNQQPESLKCPRCDSSNTKFCYYNNYNKLQPRHFCRACKRHWTKGGTLRNVPVGGGRKNKRVRKPTTTTTTTATTTSTNCTTPVTPNMAIQALIRPPSMFLQQNLLMNIRDSESKDFGISSGNGMFLSSTNLHLPPQNQSFLFPFSSSSSFDTNPCSSSNVNYNYGEEFKTIHDESTINSTVMPSTQPWEIAAKSGGMETSTYWNWEDIDSLVSTDLKDPWNDSDIKP